MPDTINVTSMQQYCLALKEYLEAYQQNDIEVQIYGNKINELRTAIADENPDETRFFLKISGLFGEITRILRGRDPNIPFQDWVGGPESFTKEYFADTLLAVWPDLVK